MNYQAHGDDKEETESNAIANLKYRDESVNDLNINCDDSESQVTENQCKDDNGSFDNKFLAAKGTMLRKYKILKQITNILLIISIL